MDRYLKPYASPIRRHLIIGKIGVAGEVYDLRNDVSAAFSRVADDIDNIVKDSWEVKISSNDTTSDYLVNKIVGGTNVTVNVRNPGGNESLEISSESLLLYCDVTMTAGTVVRRTATGISPAQADTEEHSTSVVGVLNLNTSAGIQGSVVTNGPVTIKFGADPTVGSLCYLSTSTAGQAQTDVPAGGGDTQRLRLGYVVSAVGGGTGLATVILNTEKLPVPADGTL